MRDQSVVRVSTRIQVAMGGVLVALGLVMGNVLPVAQDAKSTVLAGLAALGSLMIVTALAVRQH
ncbi:MAG: hypothetical protein QOD86_2969 [Miltoncostaeaceae bacterium]|nr:hypothetical protein [Miltoncostaeaceae bacterium]